MILFRADRLIDGTGAPALEGAAVIVEGDRILDAGRAADIGIPLGALIIDAPAGGTLMPGLIDVHVHLAYCGSKDSNAFRAESATMEYPAIALRAVRFARDTLRHGYTSVRDMHAPGGTIIDLRDAVNAGLVEGPRILAPGLGLTVTGGHMDQPGFADHMTFQEMNGACANNLREVPTLSSSTPVSATGATNVFTVSKWRWTRSGRPVTKPTSRERWWRLTRQADRHCERLSKRAATLSNTRIGQMTLRLN
jgi:imidazolonepropionase-like amidohydrolase